MKKMLSRFLFGAVLLLAVLLVLTMAGCGAETPDDTQTTADTAIVDATEPAGYDDATPLKMMRGSSITLVEPIGICFSGSIDQEYYDALKAAYGENAVKVGMLFTLTENLTANSLDFTAEALDACDAVTGTKYVKVQAAPQAGTSACLFECTLTGIPEENYARAYSAVAYLEVGGRILRYSPYSEAVSSASFAEVAESSLWDLSDTKEGRYRNEVEVSAGTVKYSPYTPQKRELLASICYPHPFTVMSYNIAVYDSPSGGAAWEGRDPTKVVETILTQSPDIVGLQEVNQKITDGWDGYLATLAREGGYTRLQGSYTRDGFEKNEILFKTDKFSVVEGTEGTVSFKQTASDLSVANTEKADTSLDKHDRNFHYVVLEQKETGRKILFVNTHLHYGGTGSGHEEDDKVRRYEIRTLLAWLEIMAKKYPDQIVTGDLNANYNAASPNNGGTRTIKLLLDGGFERTSAAAKVTGDVGGTLANDNRRVRAEWVFDYVMTKGTFAVPYYTAVNNNSDVGRSYPSDHLPVMAQICLR